MENRLQNPLHPRVHARPVRAGMQKRGQKPVPVVAEDRQDADRVMQISAVSLRKEGWKIHESVHVAVALSQDKPRDFAVQPVARQGFNPKILLGLWHLRAWGKHG